MPKMKDESLHFIWVGNARLPSANQTIIASWSAANPEVRTTLWVDDAQSLGPIADSLRESRVDIQSMKNLSLPPDHKLRLSGSETVVQAALKLGGVYFDSDVPADSLLAKGYSASASAPSQDESAPGSAGGGTPSS